MNAVRVLRPVSLLETLSWTALIVATVVKHTGGSATGVHILGPVHGVLFLTYVFAAYQASQDLSWPRELLWKVIGAAFVPGAGLWVHQKVLAQHV